MTDFKKGQLVAVGTKLDWELRIYQYQDNAGYWCMNPVNGGISPYGKENICPAEDAFPEIFLGCDYNAIEKLNQRIHWLCKQIMANALYRKQSEFCPPIDMPTGPDGLCHRSCETCWEQASQKAVE